MQRVTGAADNWELFMLTTRDRYSLECFNAGTVKTAAFDKAIRIYCDATGGRIKTDASQIVYWAERKRSDFSSKGDYVEVLGLFRDGQVVGFALTFYIPEQKLYVVDHIAITPSARSMTAFERFCDLIEAHVKRAAIYADYCIAEVSIDMNGVDPLLNAETITRLLQIKGFRVADCEYLTPSADKKPPYRPVQAKLLLHSTGLTRIASSKVLAITEAMHEGLYKNWYKPFAEDFEGYCKHLREIREFVQCNLGNKEYVPLQGHPPINDHVEIKDVPQQPAILVFYLILVVALAIGAAAAISWLGIGIYSVLGGAIAVAICVLAITALWFDNAARLVRYGIDAVVSISGKQR